jgi:hypothetical protein
MQALSQLSYTPKRDADYTGRFSVWLAVFQTFCQGRQGSERRGATTAKANQALGDLRRVGHSAQCASRIDALRRWLSLVCTAQSLPTHCNALGLFAAYAPAWYIAASNVKVNGHEKLDCGVAEI